MASVKIKAFFLDLDDTLLINDMETFSPHYYRALLEKMRGVCPPGVFLEALNNGVRAMWHNDGRQATNADVFRREFFGRINRKPEEVDPVLDAFYTQEFEELAQYTEPDPDARELVELLQHEGFQIAIATQPLFPLTAITARLRWAGVGPEMFEYDWIASYETMKACKPRSAYFKEILRRLDREPAETIMVGDSIESDMPARRLGLSTFWVDRGRVPADTHVVCDAQGTLRDLISLVQTGAIHEL